MKIGFFGTPDIAAYCLERLQKIHEIKFVVTGEDKPAGRQRKLQASPVKEIAIAGSIQVLQPSSLLDNEFIETLRRKDAEIYVIVAYGKIIPAQVFSIPVYKSINLHPSLLPKYRGAAPMQWALINGESVTGITVQVINERMDAGDILMQKSISLGIDTTFEDLYKKVLPEGYALLIETLNRISSGTISPAPQKESDATFCGKIGRETACINWSKSSLEIHNLVRGLSPRPCAWSNFRGKNMKILRTGLLQGDEKVHGLKPGETGKFMKHRLVAGTGDGCIEILQIQPETKKSMDGASFINGYRLTDGDLFEL